MSKETAIMIMLIVITIDYAMTLIGRWAIKKEPTNGDLYLLILMTFLIIFLKL